MTEHLLKHLSRVVLPLLFVAAGVFHFLEPDVLTRIVPPQFPAPRLLVYLSGLAEVAGGVGLLLPSCRRFAAWGLVVLLVAVFPANVYMASHSVQLTATPLPQWLLWARLPLQAFLIAWIWWTAKSNQPNSSV